MIRFRSIARRMAGSTNLEGARFDRAFGCLLGQAIGDALGTRYEFQKTSDVREMIRIDRNGSNGDRLPILGGGPFNCEPGQVTDDTEMAMALARSVQRRMTFDPEDVAASYVTWYQSDPPDIGQTTERAFQLLPAAGEAPILSSTARQRMLEASNKFNKDSLSNGCLMRISPLAVAGSSWASSSAFLRALDEDCRLTHSNPIVRRAVAAYATAVRHLILTGDLSEVIARAQAVAEIDPDRNQLVEVALIPGEANGSGSSNSASSLINQYLTAEQPTPISLADGRTVEGDTKAMGYFGIALQWAFWELRNYQGDFEQALVRVVSRGGDTDTNACIAGALLGAHLGAERLPDYWKATMLSAQPRRLNRYQWASMADLSQLTRDLLTSKEPLSLE